ncbi:MAG: SLC13 family permease [Bosea sp. (in: a-proteobacteria)]|uniref:SLC13 family permease n=1 Tax=Bosea sp. (in: a-proteobacteria) TaxID=1871050 RepID=UPI0025BCC64F|nr:SLC13 family permease [Bosea sp. (in: a-proteobacteria)]MDP3603526.1 SLC13 family permease [Bosea sp. (in: a-proteobacteria)]WRH59075.1 MAG: SLC13 family permease [Bosea sp. (in: a-proteobacteria)]
MSPIAYTALIIAAAVVLFVTNRVPVVLVAMGTALSLWATGVLTLPQALGGLGDPAVIFIAALFVVSSGLEVTGVTAWAGQLLIKGAGEESRTRLLLLTMGLVALLTALISVNGAVAALLPVVVVIAVRLKRNSSQLLMPLVFAAHAGSMLALTGTPVNVLVSEAASDAGVGGFGFFEFALAGIPLLAGSMAIMILFGQKLLPERNGATMPADFSRHAKTLVEQYGLASGVYQLRVRASCPYIGQAATAIDLSAFPGLQFVAIQDGDSAGPLRRDAIAEGDHVLLRGDAEAAATFAATMHLAFRDESAASGEGEETLFNKRSGLAEVVIPPRSGLIGQSVFPGMVTESGDLIILAVQRSGNEIAAGNATSEAGGVVLQAGDTMLLQGTWKALDTHLDDPDVLVVSSPELVRRQAVPMGPGAKQAVVILFGMVLLLATGIVPPAVAGLLAAGAIILTGIMTVEQSYRAISWTTVILVGAMMPLSTAMVETGAAKLLAERLVLMVGDAGPMALLAGLFILTAVMGQLISNTATALIVIPIGVAAAASMGISPKPVLMSTAVAAAGAFLTPIATPTNLMVMGPGGYAFSDYWKLGLPLLIWFFIVAVFIVPLIWRF